MLPFNKTHVEGECKNCHLKTYLKKSELENLPPCVRCGKNEYTISEIKPEEDVQEE